MGHPDGACPCSMRKQSKYSWIIWRKQNTWESWGRWKVSGPTKNQL